MPEATIRGVRINYLTLGDSGPWVTFNPGGRRDHTEMLTLARGMVERGMRVLLQDRRNSGASEVSIDGEGGEAEIWSDDLAELARTLGISQIYVGGSSSGCRLAIVTALRHPKLVRGLLLWRLTGGREVARMLSENYYDQYVEIASKGGMAAICEGEHFRDVIKLRPANRDRLMAMDPKDFIAVMKRWGEDFMAGADLAIVGVSEAQFRSLTIPVCMILANDKVHRPIYTRKAHELIADSEIHEMVPRLPDDQLHDRFVAAEWNPKMPAMAELFSNTVLRNEAKRKT